MNEKTTTIPQNTEHSEALQAEINARRAETKAKMSDAERARLDVIEECSAKLEAARVPFFLWGAPWEPDEKGYLNWFHFNKMAYPLTPEESSFDAYKRTGHAANWSLFNIALCHLSEGLNGSIVCYGSERTPFMMYEKGSSMAIPPPLKPDQDRSYE